MKILQGLLWGRKLLALVGIPIGCASKDFSPANHQMCKSLKDSHCKFILYVIKYGEILQLISLSRNRYFVGRNYCAVEMQVLCLGGKFPS